MYWMPTFTFERRPSSVTSPGVSGMARSWSGDTSTSSRSRSTWLGRWPSTASNVSVATATESGCATQVPSKPSPASRSLSARTASSARRLASSSVRLGITADIPPIACAPRRWQVFTNSSV